MSNYPANPLFAVSLLPFSWSFLFSIFYFSVPCCAACKADSKLSTFLVCSEDYSCLPTKACTILRGRGGGGLHLLVCTQKLHCFWKTPSFNVSMLWNQASRQIRILTGFYFFLCTRRVSLMLPAPVCICLDGSALFRHGAYPTSTHQPAHENVYQVYKPEVTASTHVKMWFTLLEIIREFCFQDGKYGETTTNSRRFIQKSLNKHPFNRLYFRSGANEHSSTPYMSSVRLHPRKHRPGTSTHPNRQQGKRKFSQGKGGTKTL